MPFRLPPNARSRSLAVLEPMFGIPRPDRSVLKGSEAAASEMPAIIVADRLGPSFGSDMRSPCRRATKFHYSNTRIKHI